MTLLEALDDPDLFASYFPSPDWDAWRAFVCALDGLPMTRAQRAVYRACTNRRHPPTTPASEAWVVCGRRSGKSRISAVVASYLAALAPTDRLAPGETGVVLIIAVDRAQAQVILNYVRALFDVPALRALVVGEGAESIDLAHGVRIQVGTSSFRSVRGVTLLAAVLDEVAFLRDEGSALPDLELYRALKPALATTGGVILGISSPWAQRGLLWSKYRKHFGHDGDVLVWQAPTTTMNPTLSAQLVAEALEDDPEAARAEWEATFRSDLESYVSTQVLERCTTPNVTERPATSGLPYVAFLDAASGAGQDAFAAAVAHAEVSNETTVVVLDAVRVVTPPFDPLATCAELAQFLRTYSCQLVQSDKYAGAFVTEAFARAGIALGQDSDPKSQLYLGCLPLLTSTRLDLLDLPQLRSQFAALERRRRAGGRDVVDHPPGAHDDLANAVAGVAVLAATQGCWDDAPFAANVGEARRERVLDDRELSLFSRIDR